MVNPPKTVTRKVANAKAAASSNSSPKAGDVKATPSTDRPIAPNDKHVTPERSTVRLVGALHINTLLAFSFGVVFLGIMLILTIAFPNPTPIQVKSFVTALALSAAGVGAVLPGFFEFRYMTLARAGGALALFATVFWQQPVIEREVVSIVRPAQPVEPTIKAFLDHLDAGDLATSYADLDELTRGKISPALWKELYEANLGRLGKMEKRKRMGLVSLESPQGYPVGLYEGYTYIAKYKNDQACRREQAIARATQSKQWKIFTYNIDPQPIECGKDFSIE